MLLLGKRLPRQGLSILDLFIRIRTVSLRFCGMSVKSSTYNGVG
jgi:hypothetical protein